MKEQVSDPSINGFEHQAKAVANRGGKREWKEALPKRLAECRADWDGVTADRMRQVDSLTGWTMRRRGGELPESMVTAWSVSWCRYEMRVGGDESSVLTRLALRCQRDVGPWAGHWAVGAVSALPRSPSLGGCPPVPQLFEMCNTDANGSQVSPSQLPSQPPRRCLGGCVRSALSLWMGTDYEGTSKPSPRLSQS